MTSSAEIIVMTQDDADPLAALIACQSSSYLKYFVPFGMSAADWHTRLSTKKRDQYWIVRYANEMAGFCSLRGFDEGYTRPSFGVFIAQEFSGRGLAKLALTHCIEWCRSDGTASDVLLKVHPDNTPALKIYRMAGFVPEGICPNTGHTMMNLRIEPASRHA